MEALTREELLYIGEQLYQSLESAFSGQIPDEIDCLSKEPASRFCMEEEEVIMIQTIVKKING